MTGKCDRLSIELVHTAPERPQSALQKGPVHLLAEFQVWIQAKIWTWNSERGCTGPPYCALRRTKCEPSLSLHLHRCRRQQHTKYIQQQSPQVIAGWAENCSHRWLVIKVYRARWPKVAEIAAGINRLIRNGASHPCECSLPCLCYWEGNPL